MMKTIALKIVNPVLGVLLLSQALTGLVHGFLPRRLFEVVHQGNGVMLVLVAAIHVILNWSWIKANFLQKPIRKTSGADQLQN